MGGNKKRCIDCGFYNSTKYRRFEPTVIQLFVSNHIKSCEKKAQRLCSASKMTSNNAGPEAAPSIHFRLAW